jgi:uncharacterized membrane protein YczE
MSSTVQPRPVLVDLGPLDQLRAGRLLRRTSQLVLGLYLFGASLALLPAPEHLPARVAVMAGGVVLCGFASALYIGAQFGRGPRDGLMTGLSRRTGYSLRSVRTALEVGVVILGILLGGVAGVGTIAYALGIGPLTQALLPWFLVPLEIPRGTP